MQHALIVLGMHRSGTSAMAGLLHLLGVELGADLMPPNPYNEAGHWEHAGIVAVHDRLLEHLGSSWEDVCPLPADWWSDAAIAPLRAELVAIAARDFGTSPAWGLKDPRLSHLLPLWQDILTELGCRPHYVIMVRHPGEVAASLRRRDGLTAGQSYLLWAEHLLAAEHHSRGASRAFVAYDDLLRDWRAVADRLAATFALAWPTAPDQASRRADDFLSTGFRHHAGIAANDAPAWVDALHGVANAAARSHGDMPPERVAAAQVELDALGAMFWPVVARLRQREATRAEREITEREAKLASVEAESTVRAGHLASLEQHFKACETYLVALEQEHARRGELLQDLGTEVADLRRVETDLRAEVERLHAARRVLEVSPAGRLLLRLVPSAAGSRR